MTKIVLQTYKNSKNPKCFICFLRIYYLIVIYDDKLLVDFVNTYLCQCNIVFITPQNNSECKVLKKLRLQSTAFAYLLKHLKDECFVQFISLVSQI